jgi:hypothetical protein
MSSPADTDQGIVAEVRPSDTAATLEAQEETRELLAIDEEQLTAARKSAEAWRAGLGGLIAIVTGALFIKGKESVDEVTEDTRVLLAFLVFGAILAAVAGTYYALRAANGQPKVSLTDDIADAGGVSAFRRNLAISATRDLRVAQFLAFGAVVLLSAGVLVTWFADKPTAEPLANLKVTVDGGERLCGINEGVANERLRLEIDGNRRTVAVSSLRAVELVEKCE